MNASDLFERLFNAALLKAKTVRSKDNTLSTSFPLQVEHLEPRMMLNGDAGTVLFEAGFEDANVAAKDFGFFRNVSGFTATQGAVEVQNTHPAVGPAAEGAKHLELDGNNEIAVDIDTASAAALRLDLAYSPRAGASVLENEIEVLWNDEVVTTLSADGSNNQSTDFRSFSIDLPIEGDATTGELVFRSKFSGGRGVGGLLDDIVVTAQLGPLTIENIADQTVGVNTTFNIDADLIPPNSDAADINFRLVKAPVGATIDASTGEFRWRASERNISATLDRETETTLGTPQTVLFAGFEDVEVSARRFDFFETISGFQATGRVVEVQKDHPAVGPASQGSQHIEIDGENGIARTINTVEGDRYELTFDFSPRAGADPETNAIEVLWDGEVIHEVTADGRGNRSTDFSKVTVDLSDFTGDRTQLEFRSKTSGTSPGFGGLIDNVRVTRQTVSTVTSENPFRVIVRATDSNGRADNETFGISIDQDGETVTEPPVVEAPPVIDQPPVVEQPPVVVDEPPTSTPLGPLAIEAIADQTFEANRTLAFDADLVAPDNDLADINFQLAKAPVGARIDASTGDFRWRASERNISTTLDRETETTVGTPQVIVFADFEDVEVSARRFDFFDSISGFEATGRGVEVQKNHPAVGPASQGNQHIELDGQNGIVRTLDTVVGDLYELTFDFSPRAGAAPKTNAIEVLWDGEVIHEVTADGRGNRSTDYSEVTVDLSDFTGDQTQLEFRSKTSGNGSGFGGLIDNVRVTRQTVTTVTSENPFEVIISATDSNGRTDTATVNLSVAEDREFKILPVIIEEPPVEAPPVVEQPPVVDETAPTVLINPIMYAEAGTVTISGTSADNVAIDRNRLLLFNRTTEQYWNGTAWTDQWSRVEPSGTENWSFTIDLPAGDYRAVAWTWDAANNIGNNLVNFTVAPARLDPVELSVAIENLNDALPDGWTLATRTEGNDVWFRTLAPNGNPEIDFRFGSSGVIGEIRDIATGDSLLAPTFAGEVTDRVVQWTLWETGLTVVNDVESLPDYEDRFNITQAGTFDNVLNGTVDVDLNAEEGQIDVWAVVDHNWKSEQDPYLDGSITALTRTEILDGGAILVRRVIRIGEINLNGQPVTLDDPYFESWNPLSDSAFDSLALSISAGGNPDLWFADGVNIPFYADLPVYESRGWAVSYDRNNIANGRNMAIIFGTQNGTVHHEDGSDTSTRRFDLNLQDFAGGVSILPGLYPGSLSEGAIIDQHIILLPGNGINATTPAQLDALSAHLPPPQVYHAGVELDGELFAIADRLSGLTDEPRVATDNLARLL